MADCVGGGRPGRGLRDQMVESSGKGEAITDYRLQVTG